MVNQKDFYIKQYITCSHMILIICLVPQSSGLCYNSLQEVDLWAVYTMLTPRQRREFEKKYKSLRRRSLSWASGFHWIPKPSDTGNTRGGLRIRKAGQSGLARLFWRPCRSRWFANSGGKPGFLWTMFSSRWRRRFRLWPARICTGI